MLKVSALAFLLFSSSVSAADMSSAGCLQCLRECFNVLLQPMFPRDYPKPQQASKACMPVCLPSQEPFRFCRTICELDADGKWQCKK